MNENGHERYEDELAAYMLGSLEPEEAASFEDHLIRCERCQARERWLRTSVEILPSSVEQVEPPPALRERLMETVRLEAGVTQEAAPARGAERRSRAGLRAWLGSLSLRPATALAGVVVLLAAGVAGYAIGREGGGPNTTTISVTGTPTAPQTAGTLVRTGDRGVLRVSNLPQRPGRVYEVWLLQDKRPVPAALFQVGKDGTGSAGIPAGLDRSTQVMISSEPGGGSSQPTTQPVLSAMI
jgi:anti-sigma-K factor RskA